MTYSICHQLKGALVLQLEIEKKNRSTAPLHRRIFIRFCLQHSQGDLFSSTASERTMTLADSCCFHHLKWLPTQHLYIWCVFLLNPGVYMPLLIMFFPAVCKLRPYGTLIEECAFLWLGMWVFADGSNPGKTICGQWVNDVCMGIKAKEYCSVEFSCGCD